MWLGRGSDSSEHLIATSHGVIKSRTINKVIPSEKWNRDVFDTFTGYPWTTKGDGSFDLSLLSHNKNTVIQTPVSDDIAPPPGLGPPTSGTGPREEGPEDLQGHQEPIQDNQMKSTTSTCIIGSSSR